MIEVLDKGFLTISVSASRHGLERYGVPGGGPMDLCRYTLANRLVGNEDTVAALEATMVLPGLKFCDDCTFAIVGGACDPTLLRGGQKLPISVGEAVRIKAGDVLLKYPLQTGCRAYLAVSGGIILDTCRPQPLRSGDKMALGAASGPVDGGIGTMPLPMPGKNATLRVITGVHADQFSPDGLSTFYTTTYTYSPQSNRMGIRLAGERITFAPGSDGNIISEGMMPGDIQVTSAGQPILMMADCQTVGGYAKIAHVITADLPIAAQLCPGALIHFKEVSIPEAQAAWRKLHYHMDACLVTCAQNSK